jgi:hypothetical protein
MGSSEWQRKAERERGWFKKTKVGAGLVDGRLIVWSLDDKKENAGIGRRRVEIKQVQMASDRASMQK